MRIEVLMGSPNASGSTAMLAREFAAGAREAGHDVEVADVAFSFSLSRGFDSLIGALDSQEVRQEVSFQSHYRLPLLRTRKAL